MKLEERAKRLATAGIELIRPWPPNDPSITPVDVAWSASACGPESGRVDRTFDDADPEQVSKANAAWLELGQRFGLFDRDGRFLLSVVTGADDDAPARWFLAALRSGRGWDLFGAGARDGVLGFPLGFPGFRDAFDRRAGADRGRLLRVGVQCVRHPAPAGVGGAQKLGPAMA